MLRKINKSKSYWAGQNIGYLKEQVQAHGVRLDPSLFTGRKEEFDVVTNKKVIKKITKITKAELLVMLYAKLGIAYAKSEEVS